MIRTFSSYVKICLSISENKQSSIATQSLGGYSLLVGKEVPDEIIQALFAVKNRVGSIFQPLISTLNVRGIAFISTSKCCDKRLCSILVLEVTANWVRTLVEVFNPICMKEGELFLYSVSIRNRRHLLTQWCQWF